MPRGFCNRHAGQSCYTHFNLPWKRLLASNACISSSWRMGLPFSSRISLLLRLTVKHAPESLPRRFPAEFKWLGKATIHLLWKAIQYRILPHTGQWLHWTGSSKLVVGKCFDNVNLYWRYWKAHATVLCCHLTAPSGLTIKCSFFNSIKIMCTCKRKMVRPEMCKVSKAKNTLQQKVGGKSTTVCVTRTNIYWATFHR